MKRNPFFRPCFLILALAILPINLAGAADAPSLESGARVRLNLHKPNEYSGYSRTVEGTLVDLDAACFTLAVPDLPNPLVIERTEVRSSAYLVRPGRRNRSALIGLATGAAVGAVFGLAQGDDPPGFLSFSAEAKAGVFAVLMAPVGALVGALAGPGAQWEDIPESKVQLGLIGGADLPSGAFVAFRF